MTRKKNGVRQLATINGATKKVSVENYANKTSLAGKGGNKKENKAQAVIASKAEAQLFAQWHRLCSHKLNLS